MFKKALWTVQLIALMLRKRKGKTPIVFGIIFILLYL